MGLLMLAAAADHVDAAQADLVSIGSAFGQVADVEAAQDANKENQPAAGNGLIQFFYSLINIDD